MADETLIELMRKLMPHHPDLLDIRDLIAAGYTPAQIRSLKGLDGNRTLAEMLAEGPAGPSQW
ncbi:hypothetical protein ACFP3R_24695 [Saccharothrix lopnurensis]|uniref:Uncharacterized protein n=2 Tax=Saccharothrix lopnurensis TaxID=1670621 RepID=A0ABW1PA77_9PSEU